MRSMKGFLFLFLFAGALFSLSSFVVFGYPQRTFPLGQFGQAFSGLLTATVSINPLFATIVPPDDAEALKPFSLDVKLENRGEARIGELESRIFLPDGLILLGGGNVKKSGVLLGGEEKFISFRIRAERAGSYIVSVSTSGNIAGTSDTIYTSDSAVIEVHPPNRIKPRGLLGLLSDYLQIFLNML